MPYFSISFLSRPIPRGAPVNITESSAHFPWKVAELVLDSANTRAEKLKTGKVLLVEVELDGHVIDLKNVATAIEHRCTSRQNGVKYSGFSSLVNKFFFEVV